MNVHFEMRPCIILETVELLYAYVNQIPTQKLTGDGPCCIPGWDLQQIIHDCCAGLADRKSVLQYYFGRASIQDAREKSTCLARNIFYDTLNFSSRSLEEAGRNLHESWRVTRAKGLRPYRIGEFSMDYSIPQETEYTPLSNYFERLPVLPGYQKKLLEAFAGYDDTVDELISLIRPVAAMLVGFAAPGFAVHADAAEAKGNVCFTQVSNSEVSAEFPLQTVREEEAQTPEYADDEVVRVSIVLKDRATTSCTPPRTLPRQTAGSPMRTAPIPMRCPMSMSRAWPRRPDHLPDDLRQERRRLWIRLHGGH